MKKVISITVAVLALLSLLSGCANLMNLVRNEETAPENVIEGPFLSGGVMQTEGTEPEEDYPAHEHIYADIAAEEILVQEATCEDIGIYAKECTICGKAVERLLPMLGHDYEYFEEITCGQKGVYGDRCTRCGHEENEELVYVQEHEYLWIEKRTATCYQDGYTVWKCAYCGDEWTETVPMGHEYSCYMRSWHNGPNCQNNGIAYYECIWCGGGSYTQEVPPLDHKYEAGECMYCGALNSSYRNDRVQHYGNPLDFTNNGTGRITQVQYKIRSNIISIVMNITKTSGAGEFRFGWTLYDEQMNVLQTGDATTGALEDGESITLTVRVNYIVDSDDSKFLVQIGAPHSTEGPR